MFRRLKAWWTMLSGIGPIARISAQSNNIMRYHVIETIAGEGLFDYLQVPHTYSEILAHFGYIDSDYIRDLLTILAMDKENLLIKDNEHYRRNPSVPIPTYEDVVGKSVETVYSISIMAKGITKFIPARLRNEPVEFPETFEEDGRQLLTKFDQSLGNRAYSAVRDTAFDLLTREEREWLRGKRLLDVGCGSGRETADLWAKYDGDIHLVAIDPVPSLIELAGQRFGEHLGEIMPGHAPLTGSNRPEFKVASALDLPFPDNSIDAAFHSLVLHWTADPRQAIREIVRVLKPGGLVFGTQVTKPRMDAYFDIVIRANEDIYGFFWPEEFLRWYAENGVRLEVATLIGTFRGRKPIA